MSLKVGDVAPDFTIFDTEKKAFSLSEYKGKNVVLLFFPFAFSSVCTEELCGIRDNISSYSNVNAEVVAISVDSPIVLAKFKEEEGYNFRVASDFNKVAMSAFGAMYEDLGGLKGVAKRSAFVIDKEGIIRYAEVLEIAKDIPNFAAVQETLSKL
jgi:glutaredoxin-dependent peroxiredoxin